MDDLFKYKIINRKTKDVQIIDDLYWFEENQIRNIRDGIAYGIQDYYINRSTGKYDKEGNLIFENDILISDDYGDEAYMIWIQWHDELCAFDVWTLVGEDDWEWHGSDDTMQDLTNFTVWGSWQGGKNE